MKRTIAWVFSMVLVAGVITLIWGAKQAKANPSGDLVGAWQVDAVGAPYVPHQFVFTSDGIMLSTNPTNVQENPASPHGGTNDSLGMGAWRKDGSGFVGTFYELNAFADNHQPTDTLEVRFRITVDGDHLTGDWLIVAFDARGTFDGHRLLVQPWIPA